MKRLVSILICILILTFCLSACASRETEPETLRERTVNLWYAQSSLSPGLIELAEEFNRQSTGLTLILRSFETEEELGRALDSARPELILCSHKRAFALYEQDRLMELSVERRYSDALSALSGSVGSSFFPVGAATEFLVSNTELSYSTMEELCAAAAEGQLSLGVRSFTGLFQYCMGQLGTDFYGVKELDMENDQYKYIYNLFAEAAYGGGLKALEEQSFDRIQSSELTAAIFPSSALSTCPEELHISPLPPMAEGDKLYTGELWGLAVTAPFKDMAGATELVVQWFASNDNLSRLALSGGLVPLTAAEANAGSELAEAAFELYMSHAPALPDTEPKDDFEEQFRAALEMLSDVW